VRSNGIPLELFLTRVTLLNCIETAGSNRWHSGDSLFLCKEERYATSLSTECFHSLFLVQRTYAHSSTEFFHGAKMLLGLNELEADSLADGHAAEANH
jgi:hypothetical protein